MKRTFPPFVLWLGVPAIACTWLLATRLVWEQTVWTWERGAQMVGFSLGHSGFGAILLLGVLASLAWPLLVLVAIAWSKNFGGRKVWGMLIAYGIAWAFILTPYGFWQRLFIGRFSPEQSVELMTFAAARGDTKTVDAFLRAGVPLNAQGRHGTALHAAAVQAELNTMHFLLARGADVNAINVFGDSPMENARQAPGHSAEALGLLAKHGGLLVRGTDEQRNEEIERQVREDVERLEKLSPQ